MKVKEVIEILGVTADKLINQLDNVGIEDADLETEIPNEVIKKLSKLYKTDIKPMTISYKEKCATKANITNTPSVIKNTIDSLILVYLLMIKPGTSKPPVEPPIL